MLIKDKSTKTKTIINWKSLFKRILYISLIFTLVFLFIGLPIINYSGFSKNTELSYFLDSFDKFSTSLTFLVALVTFYITISKQKDKKISNVIIKNDPENSDYCYALINLTNNSSITNAYSLKGYELCHSKKPNQTTLRNLTSLDKNIKLFREQEMGTFINIDAHETVLLAKIHFKKNRSENSNKYLHIVFTDVKGKHFNVLVN